MENDDKPFITDDIDMLATMIVLVLIVVTSAAISIFALYELWRLAVYLLHLV